MAELVDLPAQAGAHVNMQFWVYVLKSTQKNWYYVGITQDLNRRFQQHNSGKVRSSKAYLPFKLFYKKEFPNRLMARDYEKFLKIRSNKEKLIRSIK